MKRFIFALILFAFIMPISVSAAEFTAPAAPDSAQEYMPQDTESFSEGLWYIVKTAISNLQPSIAQAAKLCLSLLAVMLLISMLQGMTSQVQSTVHLVGVLAISYLLLQSSKTMIQLGTQTVEELTQYAQVLLPVITAAMSAQGYITTSAALYTGTVIFNTVLTSLISHILIPVLYAYLFLSIGSSALSESTLSDLKGFAKWLMTWGLKIILYVFTGYISITGVIGGSADATAVKAAKLTISSAVPVVGSILSDASEAVLVGAGVMKNTAGIYGLLAILSICIGPFLNIGIQYLFLKLTTAFSGAIGQNNCVKLLEDFTAAMGIVLSMTGTVCLMIIISIVCFMKGAA